MQQYIEQAIVPLVHFPGCALCSWWLCFRTTVRWTLGTKQSSTGSWCTLFQNSNFDLLQNLGDPLGGAGSFISLINFASKQYCIWYTNKQASKFSVFRNSGSHELHDEYDKQEWRSPLLEKLSNYLTLYDRFSSFHSQTTDTL